MANPTVSSVWSANSQAVLCMKNGSNAQALRILASAIDQLQNHLVAIPLHQIRVDHPINICFVSESTSGGSVCPAVQSPLADDFSVFVPMFEWSFVTQPGQGKIPDGIPGSEIEITACLLYNLGLAHERLGQDTGRDSLFIRALNIYKKAIRLLMDYGSLRANHSVTFIYLALLTNTIRIQGNYFLQAERAQAVVMLRSALDYISPDDLSEGAHTSFYTNLWMIDQFNTMLPAASAAA
jgi:tetratricopeptide (TPR) repeat protein